MSKCQVFIELPPKIG